MPELSASPPINRTRTVALCLLTDARLARLAATGDRDAFAAIYERYHQPLYRYCRSLVRHPDDALDALQSTMLNAMRGMERREAELALKPWLYRIAHNESISLLRRRPPVDELDAETAGIHGGVEHDAEGRARLRQLVDDIHELPERQRGALVMRELSGLGYDEVAAAFSVSIDAAKQSVLEARRALVDFGNGRDMHCETVCRIVSDGDRRALRGRGPRAHLRACAPCRDFKAAIGGRQSDLAAISPALAAATAAAVLQGLVGGGGGSGGGLLAGLLGGGSASSAVGKSLAAGVVTVVAGAGALGLGGPNGPLAPDGRKAEAEAAETGRRSGSNKARASTQSAARRADARRDRARVRAQRRERSRERGQRMREERGEAREARAREARSDSSPGSGSGSDERYEREDSRAYREPDGEHYGSPRENRSGSEEADHEREVDKEQYESPPQDRSGSTEEHSERGGGDDDDGDED